MPTVDFAPQGLPSNCQITYTITCPAGRGGGGTAAAAADPIDTSSTDALPDLNDEELDEDDEDYEYDDEEDEDYEYDDDIDEDELDDLEDDEDEDYEYEEDEDEDLEYDEDDDFEYQPGDENYRPGKSSGSSGIEGCLKCNVKVYKPGIQGGYDPDQLRFRDINGKFLRDP